MIIQAPLWRYDLNIHNAYGNIRNYFFECPWYDVYEFLEFVANINPDEKTNEDFKRMCNLVLEEEISAYRLVGNLITKITSHEEISEIEE